MRRRFRDAYRLQRWATRSLCSWDAPATDAGAMSSRVSLDCGWGRLLFGQTYPDHGELVAEFNRERPGQRDIAIYVRDHHVLLTRAPDQLFVDPSDTYRLWLHQYRPPERRPRDFHVRFLQEAGEVHQMNRILAACGMMETPPEVALEHQKTRTFTYFVAVDNDDGQVIGTIMGVDHKEAFDDPDNGASFWCLAAERERRKRGVGRALVRAVAEHYVARGRQYLDLSVLHDNGAAGKLYRSLGFRRVPVYAVKRKNEINRPYYEAVSEGVLR